MVQYQPHRLKGATSVGAVAAGQRGPYGVREESAAHDQVPPEGCPAVDAAVADRLRRGADAPDDGVRP